VRVKDKTAPLSLFVFIAGLVGAYAAGVGTYRAVGLYGGPVASGFRREWDPVSRRRQLIHERVTESGARIKQLYADDITLQMTDVAAGQVSIAIATKAGTAASARAGFSLRNDGSIDAWAVSDDSSGLTRIEISTKRDGRVDRWETYQKDRLLRVDLDTNGNGKPDRWMTYQDGIEMETILDVNEDGRPDGGN
jgi:hypothetical protein